MKDESGQDLAEYGIALAVIAGGVSVAVLAIKGKVGSLWSNASTEIAKF
jgi:Flp pilus assembly pilin Flp